MNQLTQIITGIVQNETYTVNHPNIGNLMYRKDNLTNQYETFTYPPLQRELYSSKVILSRGNTYLLNLLYEPLL
jgi:hypothetical protein